MKWVEEKTGATTKMRLVPDDYSPEQKETPQRDLTTGGASLIAMGISDEEYNRIFKTNALGVKTAVEKKTETGKGEHTR